MGQKQRSVSVSTETYWDPSCKTQHREKGPEKLANSPTSNTQALGLRMKRMEGKKPI